MWEIAILKRISERNYRAFWLRVGTLAIFVALVLSILPAANTSGQERAGKALFEYLSPRPGAQLVSTGTTIAFRAATNSGASLIDRVSVTAVGQRSGLHSGQLILAGDRETIIFEPVEAFAEDELVRVTIEVGRDVPEEATSSVYEYAFHVAPSPPAMKESEMWAPEPPTLPANARSATGLHYSATQPYLTAPADLPQFEITSTAGTSDGYIFMAYFNYANVSESDAYLLILDNDGEPVFYRRLFPLRAALDFKKQPNGLLTYFNPAPEEKRFYALDETYSTVGTYEAGNGYVTDLHDLQILPDGHALLMIYDFQTVDMAKLVPGGDPEATVVGCILQEIDTGGNVVFEWRSWDHISILDSNQDLTDSFIRYIHCNSIEQDYDGHILISSRHLNEVTKINRQTGEIIWRLGGAQNQFTFANDAGFFYQHDARRLPNGNLTIYDNRTNGTPEYSRAVEYALDETNMIATRVWEYRNSPDTYGPALGNHQRLPNGNSIIGWGWSSEPILSEVAPDGTEVFELSAEPTHGTYRAFRFPWEGHPTWPPRLVATTNGFAVTLHFSWNGATDVSAYRVYGGRAPRPMTLLWSMAKEGFENVFVYNTPEEGHYSFRVMAVDSQGAEMAYSNTYSVLVGGDPIYLPLIAGR